MNKPNQAGMPRRIAIPLAGLLLSALSLGCMGTRPAAKVSLTSNGDATVKAMNMSFAKAYFSRQEGGDYDIVLVDQTAAGARPADRGDGMESVDVAPLTQVLHVKVLYRPKRNSRGGNPVATNASIDWTVMSGDGAEGRINYTGVGFANVYGSDEQIRVQLRDFKMTEASKFGDIADPIGPAELQADFKARLDVQSVRGFLAAVKPVGASPSAAAVDGPPARQPSP